MGSNGGGRLLAAVEQLGYFDDSLIVFATDHGISATRAKGTLYDRGTEIALLMHLPTGVGPPPGHRVTQPVGNLDLAPTFLQAAGVPVPQRIQGHGL